MAIKSLGRFWLGIMTRRRAEEYKPLLLSTTMRNPDRMRPFLEVIKAFDGQILTNELCEVIQGEAIRRGLHKPMKTSGSVKAKWGEGELLRDEELSKVMHDNPQDHKEAGFDWGWPSRFDTYFSLMKTFGFVFYSIGSPIRFSELGNMFVERLDSLDESSVFKYDEELLFLNAFVKYHRRNPFIRVLNHNRPLVLLLQTLRELESRPGNTTPGIARHELPFLLVWRDANFVTLADYILEFRKSWGFTPSEEVIFEACEAINGGWKKAIKMKTIVREEPDETLRKFRLTGLFSLRGNGRFISCNSDKSDVIDYVLENHTELLEFETKEQYFDFASKVDQTLVGLAEVPVEHDINSENALLTQWIDHFGVPLIRQELIHLAKGRSCSNDVLKLIPGPLRLEFLATLLLKSKLQEARVVGHYRSDDEGFPISHAPGNTADIEVFEGQVATLYEVTLMTGRIQVHQELVPITRHLRTRMQTNPDSSMYFIAPNIHADANQYVSFLEFQEKMKITNQTIEEFATT